MAIRLNVFCNGQIAVNQSYLDNFDKINWGGPGGVVRDALGLPIDRGHLLEKDAPKPPPPPPKRMIKRFFKRRKKR